MTKLLALSLGILVILIFLAFTFLRKRNELSREPRLPAAELSLDETQQKKNKESSIAAQPAPSQPPQTTENAGRPETEQPASETSSEIPSPSSLQTASEATPPEEEDLALGSETDIKPETPPPPFDIKAYGVDTVLALPTAEKKKFLDRNTIAEPEKFKRFRYLNDVAVIDRFLKGRYQGTIEGKGWIVALDIAGQVEDERFSGELAVKLFTAQKEPISRSATQGPLDSHVRIVEEGDKNSLLILPSQEGESSLYQIFIGEENRSMLAGNYYEKREDGTFERIGPFVLNRI